MRRLFFMKFLEEIPNIVVVSIIMKLNRKKKLIKK